MDVKRLHGIGAGQAGRQVGAIGDLQRARPVHIRYFHSAPNLHRPVRQPRAERGDLNLNQRKLNKVKHRVSQLHISSAQESHVASGYHNGPLTYEIFPSSQKVLLDGAAPGHHSHV